MPQRDIKNSCYRDLRILNRKYTKSIVTNKYNKKSRELNKINSLVSNS